MPCQWPIGDPGQLGFHFCNSKIQNNTANAPYCEEHYALAYDSKLTREYNSKLKLRKEGLTNPEKKNSEKKPTEVTVKAKGRVIPDITIEVD